MSHDRIVPLTINRDIGVIHLHSDEGRCFALVDANLAENVSALTWFRHRRTGYPTYRRASGGLLTMAAHQRPSPPHPIKAATQASVHFRRLRLLTVVAEVAVAALMTRSSSFPQIVLDRSIAIVWWRLSHGLV